MTRFTTLGALFLLLLNTARADEGMWLLHMLQRINEADMQKSGLRLSAQDIYDINNASLKDAIVRLNGGSCTAEVISSQGLVLTNHHCAYGAIQSFSTPENDYLTDGFWAKSKDQEMHIDNFYVSFLERIDDVTERILAKLNDDMPEVERAAAVAEEIKAIQAEYNEADASLSYDVKSMYYGNEYYVFTYRDYNDVRLVAAPLPEVVATPTASTRRWDATSKTAKSKPPFKDRPSRPTLASPSRRASTWSSCSRRGSKTASSTRRKRASCPKTRRCLTSWVPPRTRITSRSATAPNSRTTSPPSGH